MADSYLTNNYIRKVMKAWVFIIAESKKQKKRKKEKQKPKKTITLMKVLKNIWNKATFTKFTY